MRAHRRREDAEQQSSARHRAPRQSGELTQALPPAAGFTALQRCVGNAAVVRILRSARGASPEDGRQLSAEGGPERAEQPAAGLPLAVHDILRGAGRPLDEATRTDMETRLGADFSDVRIHDDSAAAASAAEIDARAYTSGNHVVIGADGGDRHTLAHELTHVIQQRVSPVAGHDNGGGLRISDPSDRHEREAEANARRAMASPSRPAPTPPPVRGAGRAHGAQGAHGHGASGAHHRGQDADSVDVQRAHTRNAPAQVGVADPQDVIDLIERQGEWLGRWIDDYDAVLTELRDAWTPDLGLVPGADTLAQAQAMLDRFHHARGETGERSRHTAVVNYLLTENAPAPPGIGSFGTMTMHGTNAITGRPNFASSTKADLPTPPMQHRRHVIAWHNIRDLLNRAYATHGRALISYLETKLTDVHTGMSAESDASIANMPRAEFGTDDPAEAEVLMRAAYVMNSSVKNLWVGSGRENSEINMLSRLLQESIPQTPDDVETWTVSLRNTRFSSDQATAALAALIARLDQTLAAFRSTTPDQHDTIMANLTTYVWNHVIRSLETDVPRDPAHPSANGQGAQVGTDVYDALFPPGDRTVSLPVVCAAVDFLWTGRA
ncbi:DUF4157 domain-containing protein [Streptomyces cyaneogriseus]|uniref:eCIS core domain-containing protein n=1 Tax=Streptomyces cyaneogriseus TaxID=68192 RepID=UPI00069C8BA9|nr:DUF4157 domain-containing protein [Streptomyces cyaneogriseus]